MNSKTAVCAYGKAGEIERVFERLFTMYLSNYSTSYSYGAIIDLPDAVCYRTSADGEREELARRCVERLNKSCDGSFFCAIRQRRYVSLTDGYIYVCEGSTLGALKSLWRYLCGRKNEVFPVYGCVPTGIERIYFSSYDEESGVVFEEKQRFECIEPNGIFRLSDQLGGRDAVFPSADCEKKSRTSILKSIFRMERLGTHEALYTSEALDTLLSVGATLKSIRKTVSEQVKMTVYPSFTVKNEEKETLRLLL